MTAGFNDSMPPAEAVSDLSDNNAAEAVYIVVPAYNEQEVISEVVEGLLPHYSHIIVVNDGSSDATAERAASAGAMVVNHSVNLGQGAALQTGITYALELGAQYIITFDADGQHQPEDAQKMLEQMRASCTEVALGTRFSDSLSNVPAMRHMLLRLAILYTRWSTGLDVSDTHNGLRVFSKAAAEKLEIHQNGMAHASEILQFIADNDISYCEVPVSVHYTPYSVAKGQTNSASVRILADLFLEKFFK